MPDLKLPRPNRNAYLDYMPGSDVPVIRQPFNAGQAVAVSGRSAWAHGEHHCYRLDIDPVEAENRLGSKDEADMIELLRVALKSIEAPAEQFERLGIA